MTHRRAVAQMIAVTLLWSMAGVVTRQLEAARSFEVTFWRSAFNVLGLVVLLAWFRGPSAVWRSLRNGDRTLWISGVCWAVMYTNFMVALTLTTVANVLVTMALAPMLTALISRFALGNRLAARTWGAIVVAGTGIGWMYADGVSGGGPRHVVGMVVAFGVPLASAINWTAMQYSSRNREAAQHDLLPAVLVGAVLSAAVALPLSLPFAASAHDLRLLALLGFVQLAIPCLMVVAAARVLRAPETALLALLEVIFGVFWAWLGAHETPSPAVLGGGGLVIGALVANELLGLRGRAPRPNPSPNPLLAKDNA